MNKVTAEDVRLRFEEAERTPRDPDVKSTCICGKHIEPPVLTQKDYEEIAKILNGESQTEEV